MTPAATRSRSRAGTRSSGRRERDADGAVLRAGVRHAARGVLGSGERQPRPPRLRAQGGKVRFVIKGADSPESPVADHHRKHGDGVLDVALEVPDVDKCVAHARAAGATVPGAARHQRRARHGAHRGIKAYGDTRTRWWTAPVTRPVPAGYVPKSSAGQARSPRSSPSTTSSATSSSAPWTSGWTSITG